MALVPVEVAQALYAAGHITHAPKTKRATHVMVKLHRTDSR